MDVADKDRREAESVPVLSYARQDPERRFGLPSGRFTNVNHFTTFIAAALISTGIFAGLARLPSNPVSRSLIENGKWVSPAIVGLSVWCLLILSVKFLKIRFQRRALLLQITPRESTFVLSPTTVDGVRHEIFSLVDDPRQFVLLNRIQIALSNLRNMMRIGDVDDVLASQAEADEAMMESSYTIVRGLLWMIPILGFVGTVLGLAEAIGRFGGVLQTASDIEQLKPELSAVTAGLSTAFETTLQGLLGALLVHFTLTVTQRNEEAFLDSCREYCQEHIVGRLRLTPTELDIEVRT